MTRPEAFIICAVDEIAPGEARPFTLLSVEDEGDMRPFAVMVARTWGGEYVGYRNQCPHEGVWLNVGSGRLLTPDGAQFKCGRHGATFEIGSGLCVSGPCQGESLHPLALVVIGDDVCLVGESIAEDENDDETMDIMIHPD